MPRFKIIFLNFSFLSLALASPSCLLGENEETVRVVVGESKIFSTRAPTRVLIGNPAVADIAQVTNSEITISAKSPGITTFMYWDAFGEQSMKIRVTPEDLQETKRRVDNLLKDLNLPSVYTKIAEDEGKLLLLGKVKTPADKERINTILGALKQGLVDLVEAREEEAVVEIDVQVLELDKGASKTLGLDWPDSITLTEVGSPNLTGTRARWGTLFKTSKATRDAFVLAIHGLVEEGKARILSRPRLTCQSGKEAKLVVGGEKPIFTSVTTASSSAVTTGSVSYKEHGIILNIRPRVVDLSRIKLNLSIEVSEVGAYVNVSYAQAFPLTKRTVSTELYLKDGQTLAIGGLMKTKTEEAVAKTPGLGDIPILGFLFRKKTTTSGGGGGAQTDTELYITLTPKIVQGPPAEDELFTAAKPELREEEAKFMQPTYVPANIANYAKIVQAKINKVAYYPPQARDAGWEGNTKMSLNIACDGTLKEVKILQSSGYKILDDAATQAARSQSPYPPFPPQIENQEIWVDVSLVYKK